MTAMSPGLKILVGTELFNLIARDGATAQDIWVDLRRLFQDNSDVRINALHSELRSISQGDMPVSVYYQRVKAIGEELRELGDQMDNRSLINALLVGLSDRFDKQSAFIPLLKPPPTFSEVRSILQMEEMTQLCDAAGTATSCSSPSSGHATATWMVAKPQL
ncbi:uncharacterized protein LOC112269382 [Brachypodium distachyon]|uniref:uncharacterized protein LOC112269382 n=1 Tax=Brachypodium distachyon TaxID=15368 RepID=UPI000D0D0835|nr:uncharacterized protein LOC112269382 [Brachypodium distachyon]|eukprot:XP_024311826.1 uncharacterized protein LOC112269382 [Brachypodium distachyon]